MIIAPVVLYVTEEVWRQGHDIMAYDGIQRVGWMLNAWSFAIEQASAGPPTDMDAVGLGCRMEVLANRHGVRTCHVRVGERHCPDPREVPRLLFELFARQESLSPLDFYRAFEEIHPFVDGNGRTGKILLNWLNGTLLAPVFPPDDFWGQRIRNP